MKPATASWQARLPERDEMDLDVSLGVDLSAYATVVIDVDDGGTREQIIDAVKAFVNSDAFEDVVFDVDWESRTALRIVDARDRGQVFVEDVQLEPSPLDAGHELRAFLNGERSLDELVRSASEALLLEPPSKTETWQRTLRLPGGDAVEVAFTCRPGATIEERDFAFVSALACVAQIDEVRLQGSAAELAQ